MTGSPGPVYFLVWSSAGPSPGFLTPQQDAVCGEHRVSRRSPEPTLSPRAGPEPKLKAGVRYMNGGPAFQISKPTPHVHARGASVLLSLLASGSGAASLIQAPLSVSAAALWSPSDGCAASDTSKDRELAAQLRVLTPLLAILCMRSPWDRCHPPMHSSWGARFSACLLWDLGQVAYLLWTLVSASTKQG